MKLHYYIPEGGGSNFGDELNRYLWPHFLPNFFDDDEKEVFFGIGTILRAAKKQYPHSNILVFGSGAHAESQTTESNFKIYFVRGPLSAKAMGLSQEKAITDPAILTPLMFPMTEVGKKYSCSYMPHFSVGNPIYRQVMEEMGIHYIDPMDPVPSILERINASKLLITEAMHGAILADAYRIPWVPVASYASFNYFKWKDWSASVGVSPKIWTLPRFYPNDPKWKVFIKQKRWSWIFRGIRRNSAFLSKDTKLEELQERLLNEIASLKLEYES